MPRLPWPFQLRGHGACSHVAKLWGFRVGLEKTQRSFQTLQGFPEPYHLNQVSNFWPMGQIKVFSLARTGFFKILNFSCYRQGLHSLVSQSPRHAFLSSISSSLLFINGRDLNLHPMHSCPRNLPTA